MKALLRRVIAEFIGTAFLVTAVVGSGIAAARLSTDAGLRLFENAVATGAALVAIILAIGPVSGAHLNPVITLLDRAFRGLSSREATVYVVAQVAGGAVGAVAANAMFGLAPIGLSHHSRTGGALWLGEVVATVGLGLVVFGVARSGRSGAAPFAVGAYIAAAYFFTSSTSFENPAVTLARSLTDTFAGIAPASLPGFLVAQTAGGLLAWGAIATLYPEPEHAARPVVVPRSTK